MVRQPLVVAPSATAKDSKKQETAWRRRSLLRVRRPAWTEPAKPPAS